MDSNNNLTDILQHTFRVAIGATQVLVETLQDSEKRHQTFVQLQSQFKQKTEEFAQKGEVTEKEARQKAEEWLSQYQSTYRSSSYAPTPPTSSPTSSSNGEVQNLTEQIIALRIELENLRKAS
jgi:transposase